MRKLLPFGIFLLLVTLTGTSCNNCMECIVKDMNGVVQGEMKLCGSELDEALDDPEHYECN